jgi:hypothetical protein
MSVSVGIVAMLAPGEICPEGGDVIQQAGPGRATLFSARAIAALLAAFAASVHFAVAPDHFAEAFAVGIFMVAVGAAQFAGGFLLLLRPSRSIALALIVLTIVVMAIYAVSRTTGLPVGPTPRVPEPIGPIDVVSKATELLLLADLVYLARASPERDGPVAP